MDAYPVYLLANLAMFHAVLYRGLCIQDEGRDIPLRAAFCIFASFS